MKKCFTRAGILSVAMLLFSVAAMAQFTVQGTVVDALGEPLIGVSILVEGTTTGTVTDLDGTYDLNVPGKSGTLIFSYTGFRTEEIEVTASTKSLDLTLEEDIARLDEIVVTGLASNVKRSNSGNAVTTISAAELVGNTQPQTLDYALFGKVPGVNMSANGGSPGGGINVQLRGISTLGAGSSQPLYIIDGVYINNSSIRNGRSQVSGATGGQNSSTQDDAANRIADINPEDIERIEVLKGPSAAAIYGTRANAGVIIITTKKGQAGKTKVSFSQDLGIAQGQNFIGFDDWDEEKINNYFSAAQAPAQLEALRAAEAEGRVTDWEDFFYGETPLLSNTQLKISGGTERTQFYVSGGLTTEDGIMENSGFDRYSVRANITNRISDRIKVSVNANYLRTDNDRGFTGNQNDTGGSVGYTLAFTPSYANIFPDENGNYPDNPYFNDNPIAIRDLGINNQTVDRFLTAATLDVDIFQSSNSFLKFRVNGGIDYLSGNSQVYFPEILQHQIASSDPAGDIMWGRQDDFNYNVQAFLNYNTNFNKINSNTSVGITRLDQRGDFVLNRGQGLSGGQTNLAWAEVVSVIEQTKSDVTDLGFVIQEDLNWEDKIAISAGIRFDRSTLNVQQDEYYAFPKVSGAVNLHNFDLWASDGFLNRVKLRAAYGETGGLPRFGATFEALSSQLIGGQVGGQVGTRGVDPLLVPETASEIEFGVDLGLFNDALTLEATYYNKSVRDLILDAPPAESTGIEEIATNAAELENRGFELALSANPIRRPNFDWFTRVMYWQNRSEITSMNVPAFVTGGFAASLGTYLLAPGFSPTTIVGTPSGTDLPAGGFTIHGDRQPDFTMTWFNTFRFLKNFEFNWLLNYQNGGAAVNLSAFLWDLGGTTPDWDGDDDGDELLNGQERPAARLGEEGAGAYVEETSYLKLREAALYYTFPKELGFIDRLKLGVSANNLLLWTNYGSYDPEVSNFGSQPVSGNIEVTPFPSSRRLFFHLRAEF